MAGKKKQSNSFDFSAKTGKVLSMVINSIYTNKDVFLRELVSNALDAIEKRKYIALQKGQEYAATDAEYKVDIEIDDKKKTISITDNGIGMEKEDMIKNLGTIAQSGTEEFAENANNKAEMIGQFGVGFYSAFIVAKKVKVISKPVGSIKGHIWESDGKTGYTIQECMDPCEEGTRIIIELQDEAHEYLDKFKLKFIVETYSSHAEAKISIKSGSDVENVKTGLAIWNMDKKTITAESYKQFYNSLSHLPGDSAITIHYNAEGIVEFKSIMFVPSRQPFNLFHPDRQTRVKLYSKKVFITEDQVELLPKYLRFVYGVVECNDIPLNISRETLQANNVIKKIQGILVKKVFSELESLRKSKMEDYIEIWKNFGNVLKEGLCDGSIDRKTILDNSLFYTTKNIDKPILLEEYINNMSEGQKDIYYCIGTSIDAAMSNPQLEIFMKKGVDVLLLADTVDGFWINVAPTFKEKSFKSISTTETDLDDITSGRKDENDNKEDDSDVNKDAMVRVFTDALKDKVKAIRISKKLTESPACVAISHGDMDIAMERFLMEQNQIKKKSLKILEINPNNNLITHTVKLLEDDNTKQKGIELAETVFEIACIAQGESINNAGNFAKRLNKILSDNVVS